MEHYHTYYLPYFSNDVLQVVCAYGWSENDAYERAARTFTNGDLGSPRLQKHGDVLTIYDLMRIPWTLAVERACWFIIDNPSNISQFVPVMTDLSEMTRFVL